MKRLDDFLFDRMDAPLLDGTGIQVNQELMERNFARAKEIIERMGRLWCCHPEHGKERT